MNVRSLFTVAVCVLATGLLASPSAHAIGDITCETPEYAFGTVIVSAGVYSDPIAVTFSEHGEVIEVVEIKNPGPGLGLDDCVAGAGTSPSSIERTASTQ
jgi:hypothetical protein